MAIYYEDINLDLQTNTAYVVLGAKQYDSGRGVRIFIFENGVPREITENSAYADYRIRKPDGKVIWNTAQIRYGTNEIDIELTPASLAAAGRAYADINIHFPENNGTESTVSSASFILLIQAAPDITSGIESTSEFTTLVNTVNNADQITYMAEEWAAGTRNGKLIVNEIFDYDKSQSSIIDSIIERTFKDKIDYKNFMPGEEHFYVFSYDETYGWILNGIKSTIDLNQYGIALKPPSDGNYTPGTSFNVQVKSTSPAYNNNAKYYKNRAEAWAVGKIDGEIVDVDDETYNNNAKYWAEEAEARSNEFDEKFINTSEWNDATVYNKLSVVAYYGNTYLSKVDNNIGYEPPRPSDQEQSGAHFVPIESNYWILLAARGKKGETGSITDFEINSGTGINVNKVEGVYKYTINHSNNITASSSEKLRNFAYDAQGHITSASVVTLSASDVGAIATPANPSNGQILSYNSGWIASGLPDNIVTSDAIAQSAVTDAKISSINASKITSGTIDAARISSVNAAAVTGTLVTDNIPNLSADKITSGTFGNARIPDLSADKITSGTFGNARIATSAILSAQISSSAVTAAKISDGAIATAKLAANAVSTVLTFSIPTNATWTASGGLWYTTATVTGVGANDKVILDKNITGTNVSVVEQQIENFGNIVRATNGTNAITIYSLEKFTGQSTPLKVLCLKR